MISMESFAPLMFAGLIVVHADRLPGGVLAGGPGPGLRTSSPSRMGWFPASFIGRLPLNVFGILSNDLLLAIPSSR